MIQPRSNECGFSAAETWIERGKLTTMIAPPDCGKSTLIR